MTEDIIGARPSFGNKGGNKKQLKNKSKEESYLETERKGEKYRNLGFSTALKMINRFLTEDRVDAKGIKKAKYSKEELAEKLRITVEELEKLKSPGFYKNKANKITLDLVGLYCATKWVDDEGKNAKRTLCQKTGLK